MNVCVLGASHKPERYSYKALMMLEEHGHKVFPVHPALDEIEGRKVWPSLEALPEPVDTVTLYLSAANSDKLADQLLACAPRRVIFNPGAENPALADRLREAGCEPVEACTLVMLRMGQF